MTIVKINVIEVSEGGGADLERRFAERVGETQGARGFLGYELLRPLNGRTYFSVSRWASEEDFRAFVDRAADDVRTGEWRGATAASTSVMEFEVADTSERAG